MSDCSRQSAEAQGGVLPVVASSFKGSSPFCMSLKGEEDRGVNVL